ncbi:MAG: YlxM family DNA-binding protein [Cetobacterium sp.]|uniref:YlxM family DNA-binding protein n=1 Tax=Cetobacterium sp. TaxID=2071632 RepID=UPI003F2BC8EE
MELNEMLEVSILLDYYSNLLSDRQKEYLLEHFEEDLSLSEIGKKHSVSRQAVYDNIKRGIKILRDYEEKIGFYKRDLELLSELKELKNDFKLEKLEKIIEKNF